MQQLYTAGMVYVQTRHICIILYNNYIKHYIPSIFTYIYKPFGSQFLHIQICDITCCICRKCMMYTNSLQVAHTKCMNAFLHDNITAIMQCH